MIGSTLHRSGLTREKMSFLASLLQTDKKQNARTQVNHAYKSAKNHELDILWGGVQKGIQKVHNATKSSTHKSPAVYLTIGFVAGVLFMSLITFIVSISSMTPKTVEKIEETNKAAIEVMKENEAQQEQAQNTIQEKYIVKQGDTLNGIAYRFYGKYDEARLKEIQQINNITNPEAISIGQELLIPVSQDR